MKYWGQSIIVGALLLLSACGGGENESGKTSLASRYEAAAAIANTAQKDQTLATVAGAAAKAGDGPIVKKCIQTISNTAIKDDAAFTAAVALSKVANGQEAREVAQMISNTARRDQAFARIAKGE